MIGPYVITELESNISLEPSQMDNNIYKNLKQNLINRLEGKCYREFGYIAKIYEIKEYSDGYITAENPKAAASFKVKFTCKLCFPLKRRQLVCKIDKSNKLLMRLVNGPINVIVTMDRINKSVFFQDPRTGLLMTKKNDKTIIVSPGTYVKVTVESRTFNDTDTIIMAMGFLDSLATDEEIKENYSNEYGSDKIINFKEYIDQEEEKQNMDNLLGDGEGEEEDAEESEAEEEEEGEESSAKESD